MRVRLERMIEKLIAKELVTRALAAGYKVSVNDGEETTLRKSTDLAKIMAAMFTTDEDTLHIDTPGYKGWIELIYGNDGTDVIHDYSTNLEELVAPVMELADKIDQGEVDLVMVPAVAPESEGGAGQ